MTRTAIITNTKVRLETVQRYLPSNYSAEQVAGWIVITGTDRAGWTMDGYVIPRLASGGMYAIEEEDQT
jgi:hypothetical protein